MFEHLPNEVVLEIVQFLPLRDLVKSRLVCHLWNHLITKDPASTFIYRNLCASLFDSRLYIQPEITLSFKDWKELLQKLITVRSNSSSYHSSRPFDDTVICRGVQASSVDTETQDVVETRVDSNNRFWSSKGSKNPESDEWCVYQCQNPKFVSKYTVSYVEDAYIKFFLSSWQNNNIYSSQKVSFEFSVSKGNTLVKTPEFVCECTDTPQIFPLGMCFVYIEHVLPEKLPEPDFLNPDNLMQLIREIYDDLTDSDELTGPPTREDVSRELERRIHNEKTRLKVLQDSQGSLFVKVNYIGKVNQQPEDSLYFTCVNQFDIKGKIDTFQ